MQIPRCRATVSEDTASGHWSDLGRPRQIRESQDCRASLDRTGEGARPYMVRDSPLLASQETGANYNTNPFRE